MVLVERILITMINSLFVVNDNDGFRRDNQDQIKKSRTKLSREEQELEELIELEKEEADRLREEVLQEQLQVKQLGSFLTLLQ